MVRGNWASGRRDESSLFCKKIKRLPIEKMCRRQDDIEEGNPHNPYFSLSHKLTSGVITHDCCQGGHECSMCFLNRLCSLSLLICLCCVRVDAFSLEGLVGSPTMLKAGTSQRIRRRFQRRNNSLNLVATNEEIHPGRRPPKVSPILPNYDLEWGIERRSTPTPCFPSTPLAVADAAWEAVAASVYGKEKKDPNAENNKAIASHLNYYMSHYRPVREDHDRGRIGIEIDGAQHIFPRHYGLGDKSSLRSLCLLLAARLSQGPWEGYEEDGKPFRRPVAMYFNTIKQALVASKELEALRAKYSFDFDAIKIACLGQNENIPKDMQISGVSSDQKAKRAKSKRLADGMVDPARGVIMVVQPTDCNSEFRPPGPSIGSLGDLQKLSLRAQVNGLPVVVVSPRFLAHKGHEYRLWDQSGYQQSEIYGGAEPPRGPTPWIMRDFSPPVFCWVGSALAKAQRDTIYRPEHLSLLQSVVDEGHSWHIFKETTGSRSVHPRFKYLASTRKSSGRPTAAVLDHILEDELANDGGLMTDVKGTF